MILSIFLGLVLLFATCYCLVHVVLLLVEAAEFLVWLIPVGIVYFLYKVFVGDIVLTTEQVLWAIGVVVLFFALPYIVRMHVRGWSFLRKKLMKE